MPLHHLQDYSGGFYSGNDNLIARKRKKGNFEQKNLETGIKFSANIDILKEPLTGGKYSY
jgi:hypothetical protein